jgi:hypothetical protein
VYRGPYEYSVPGYDAADYLPQNVPDEPPQSPAEGGGGMLAATAVAQREG